ncbi:uncharacterized protein LOC143251097 isoform X1 [Tachypleus tridentatus]|uniref:uncharacterized protein LOC143251097 isoform X1 n=1 Tax=Tachypleus tridentatus TaxID=6853 RepID=UPI003FD4C7AE
MAFFFKTDNQSSMLPLLILVLLNSLAFRTVNGKICGTGLNSLICPKHEFAEASYCCGEPGSEYCCNAHEYFEYSTSDSNMGLILGLLVSSIIIVVVGIFLCCFCCGCCLLAKRRQQGRVLYGPQSSTFISNTTSAVTYGPQPGSQPPTTSGFSPYPPPFGGDNQYLAQPVAYPQYPTPSSGFPLPTGGLPPYHLPSSGPPQYPASSGGYTQNNPPSSGQQGDLSYNPSVVGMNPPPYPGISQPAYNPTYMANNHNEKA